MKEDNNMTATQEFRTVSNHNWNELEDINYDMAKEVLKLILVYEHIGNHGFTSECDNLLGEAVSNIQEYQKSLNMFYQYTSDGKDFNVI
jgi:hypothetical protein